MISSPSLAWCSSTCPSINHHSYQIVVVQNYSSWTLMFWGFDLNKLFTSCCYTALLAVDGCWGGLFLFSCMVLILISVFLRHDYSSKYGVISLIFGRELINHSRFKSVMCFPYYLGAYLLLQTCFDIAQCLVWYYRGIMKIPLPLRILDGRCHFVLYWNMIIWHAI